ncbi:MAG: hypothetical protein FD152_268 [Xanthobacteraceae bacterium]|nr:MAG: hypothetical protein FD152_268 [Xanthobacteraceae bacterium]
MTFAPLSLVERVFSRRLAPPSEPEPNIKFHVDQPTGNGLLITRQSKLVISGWAAEPSATQAIGIRLRARDREVHTTRTSRPDVQAALSALGSIAPDCGFSGEIRLPPGLVEITVEVQRAAGEWRVLYTRTVLCLSFGRLVMPTARLSQSGTQSYFFNIDRPKPVRLSVVKARQMLVQGWAVDAQTAKRLDVQIKVGKKTYNGNPQARPDVKDALAPLCALPIECGFERLVRLTFGLQKIEVFVQARDKTWLSIFSSWLFFVPMGLAHDDSKLTYGAWKQINRRLVGQQLQEMREHVERMIVRPSFTIVVAADDKSRLRATLLSLKAQIYAPGQVLVCGNHATRPTPTDAKVRYLDEIPWMKFDGDFVVFLRAGDTLNEDALYSFANSLNQDDQAELIYGDEEFVDSGKSVPFFKPAWSPDYLETFNYIGHAACFRVALVNRCGRPTTHYDFVLRFTEHARRVHHIEQVLLNCAPRDTKAEGGENRLALQGRLQRTGRRGQVEIGNPNFDYFRVKVDARHQPLVSVIIPTAGQVVQHDGRELDLILNCVSQIRERSSYRNVEIVVVDNDDLSVWQNSELDRMDCRRTSFFETKFNVAKKLNLGAAMAAGDILLLLNDDIEILSPDWIERMLEHFEKPHVGVVGPKLLYRDLTTQHVGVVHNSGNPDHVRRLYPRDDEGYFFSTCGVRNFGAVTGACMMTRRSVYESVGGYSEELAISYNDTDYCMKVQKLGLSIVYTPHAELIHFESQSRVAKLDLDEALWYQETWAKESLHDRFYNERFLSVASPTFEVGVNPRLL